MRGIGYRSNQTALRSEFVELLEPLYYCSLVAVNCDSQEKFRMDSVPLASTVLVLASLLQREFGGSLISCHDDSAKKIPVAALLSDILPSQFPVILYFDSGAFQVFLTEIVGCKKSLPYQFEEVELHSPVICCMLCDCCVPSVCVFEDHRAPFLPFKLCHDCFNMFYGRQVPGKYKAI